MPDYKEISDAARHFSKHPRSLELWAEKGYIRVFVQEPERGRRARYFVDCDEIEAAFKTNPRMRDGRGSRFPKTEMLPRQPKVVRVPVIEPKASE